MWSNQKSVFIDVDDVYALLWIINNSLHYKFLLLKENDGF